MKILIGLPVILFAIMGCNGGVSKIEPNKSSSATDSLINNPVATVTDTAFRNGAVLVAANDCLTCHRINEQSIGPSYNAVAEKYHPYEGVVENLAGKIITGGKGLWGNQAMTPHPNLAFSDAKKMVRYILSLKKAG